jgi:hypothetical protein
MSVTQYVREERELRCVVTLVPLNSMTDCEVLQTLIVCDLLNSLSESRKTSNSNLNI